MKEDKAELPEHPPFPVETGNENQFEYRRLTDKQAAYTVLMHYNGVIIKIYRRSFPGCFVGIKSAEGQSRADAKGREYHDYVVKNIKKSGDTGEFTELHKELWALKYVPNSNGPEELFHEAGTIRARANDLGTGMMINDNFLITMLKDKISANGHNKSLLAAIHDKWDDVSD